MVWEEELAGFHIQPCLFIPFGELKINHNVNKGPLLTLINNLRAVAIHPTVRIIWGVSCNFQNSLTGIYFQKPHF